MLYKQSHRKAEFLFHCSLRTSQINVRVQLGGEAKTIFCLFVSTSFKQIIFQIVITSELITQIENEEHYYASAVGQNMSNYLSTKFELTRVANEKFATRLLKSSISPQDSVFFKVNSPNSNY